MVVSRGAAFPKKGFGMESKIRSGNPGVYGCNPGIVLLFQGNDTFRIKCKINSGKARTGKQTVFCMETEVLHGKNHDADNREKTGCIARPAYDFWKIRNFGDWRGEEGEKIEMANWRKGWEKYGISRAGV